MKKKIKNVPLLNEDEMRLMRMRQLMGVFTKADSTLAQRQVRCLLSGEPGAIVINAPAASTEDGRVIFNPNMINEIHTVEGLVKINGLNYHELAHILHTPMAGPLSEAVIHEGVSAAYNVLEDQRIETLLVAEYPSVQHYLIATVAEYFLNVDKSRHSTAWPFLYGRKYLPPRMRNYFRQIAYADPSRNWVMEKAERLIDKYRLLDVRDPAKKNMALRIIKQFATVIANHQEFSPFGHDAYRPLIGGANATESGDSDQLIKEIKKQDRASDKEEEADAESVDGDDDQSDGDSSDDGDGDDGDNSDHDSGNRDDEQTQPKDFGDIESILNAAKQLAQDSPDVARDLRNQRDSMLKPDGKFKGKIHRKTNGDLEVPAELRGVAKKFGQQLSQLIVESDPGYEAYQSSGRLSVKRYVNGDDLDTIFDSWNPGKQDSDSIEGVVMVDASGSMGPDLDRALQAMWVIKRGAELAGRNVQITVIAFDNDSWYVYPPGEPAKATHYRTTPLGGMTDPQKGVYEALQIFANSNRHHKFFWVISDGAWNGGESIEDGFAYRAEEFIARMNANDILTCSVYLASPTTTAQIAIDPDKYAQLENSYRHHCILFTVIDDAHGLIGIGKKLVKMAMAGH